jgi:hypothetical protein
MIIDLRYHIVSLVAVFLALGIGILVGGSILGVDTLASQQELIAERLENHLNELREENRAVRAELALLENEISIYAQFHKDILPLLVAGRLEGKQVAIVEINRQPLEHNLVSLMETAGAHVVSVTTIPNGLDPVGHEKELLALGAWPQASLDQLPSLLAGAIAQSIVEGQTPLVAYLVDKQLISVVGEYGDPLDAVVLIGGGGDAEALPPVRALGFPMIERLQEYGLRICGVEEREAAVSAIKDYQVKLSCTVDNIDTVPGQFALVQILAGQEGHFGVKETAQRLVPLPEE